MLIAIIVDIQVFLSVFVITLFAFSQAMQILSNNNTKDKRFISGVFDALLFAYKMSLGDFDTTALGEVNYLLVIIMFTMATLFLTIMMLNILVAVISDSYARVESTSINEMYRNFADLIAENEYLVKEKRLEEHDNLGDYLYIAIVDTADGEGEAWEIHLKSIGKIVQKKTERIEKLLVAA
jgi:hypothetical protein